MTECPTSVEDLQDAVRGRASVRLRAGGSKTALNAPVDGADCLDVSSICGIVDYSPDECVITARAGTRIAEIEAALSAHGQYLAFDPPLAESGATLGGTVAAGLSGPCRYRYGGVRDFVLGARFIDGDARLIRSGGKVVKNAAGFYLHNLMVGSLGRFGVLTEITLKVFPRPEARATVSGDFPNHSAALEALGRLASSRFDLDALDFEPPATIRARIAGVADALPARLDRLRAAMDGTTRVSQGDEDESHWRDAREFNWVAPGESLVKVAMTLPRIASLERVLGRGEARRRYSVGGNVAWIAWRDAISGLDEILSEEGLTGLVVLGQAERPVIGVIRDNAFVRRVKQALDQHNRFG